MFILSHDNFNLEFPFKLSVGDGQ